ncbi:hypothetical protein SpCBS45565_g01590 [Spizellomyces sp. 'palustris']|nr:hypothetical protein SpCBS45565_g01590 [Spizellomyces sp. 'palustris']
MLDGLHEDLNRVQVRPRFTYKDEEADNLRDVEKARLSWNRYHAVNNSVIFDLFGGQLQSTVICHGCNHRSVTFDTFWDLSLPIPKAYARRSSRYSLTPSGESCSLSECLAEFAMKEILEEPYKCDNCKSHQKASKSLKLYRCPEILVLHLKRFTYSYYSRDKIETNVKFPAEGLVLDEIMSDLEGRDLEVRYDLFGISNHMGGLGGGHYIAHVRNIDDKIWYEKNDTHVSLCTDGPGTGMGPSAYVLFYQRRR